MSMFLFDSSVGPGCARRHPQCDRCGYEDCEYPPGTPSSTNMAPFSTNNKLLESRYLLQGMEKRALPNERLFHAREWYTVLFLTKKAGEMDKCAVCHDVCSSGYFGLN